jgi:hypothetical protein
MRIRLGYDIKYECAHLLRCYSSCASTRRAKLTCSDLMRSLLNPALPVLPRNFCSRLTAPVGLMRLPAGTTIMSSPVQDLVVPNAAQMDVTYLPSEPLVYRVGPRLSIVIVLLGAELSAEMEHQTAKDSAEGCPKPLGARGVNRRIRSVSPSSKIS